MLIANGADVNAKNKSGISVLARLTDRSTDPLTLQLLINAGADVNARDNSGETPLMNCKWNANPENVRVLVNGGADVNAKDYFYQTIIRICFITILENPLRKLSHKNQTPLHVAAKQNLRTIFDLLITRGADINEKDIIYQFLIVFFELR